jgi:hypothetical protein
MYGYANADTYYAAVAIQNIESLYIAARRLTNGFALRNLIVDAMGAGMIGSDIDIEEIDCDEILDSVLE